MVDVKVNLLTDGSLRLDSNAYVVFNSKSAALDFLSLKYVRYKGECFFFKCLKLGFPFGPLLR